MKGFRSAAVALWRSATREFRRLLRDPNLALVLFIAPLAYPLLYRSEERRVGKECRCRWWKYH